MTNLTKGWLAAALLLFPACAADEVGTLDNEVGSGPIDQQQPNHPFVSGGWTCGPGFTGGFAQGVTPGMAQWEVVSLYLFNASAYPVDQAVTLEIRDGAPDGPALASATAVVPDQTGTWIDYTFAPPVALSPGSPVYLYAGVDDRVAWASDRTVTDPYPGGAPYGMCGAATFPMTPGDFTFITYAPAAVDPDSDGDGLPDAEDPSTVADAVDALPASSFHAPGHHSAIDAKLADAEAALLAGDTDEARSILEHLRDHLDGCEATGAADRNDWITDCDDQDAIRALIDAILATL
jgi:hypothetical protein